MGSVSKIDWCDSSWSPVTGCLHGCEYCYARRIAERFGSHQMPIFVDYPILCEPVRCTDTYEYMRMAGISAGRIQPYPFDFTPTFHRYRLDIPKKWTKPRTIFVCSMADLFGEWVPDEWIKAVFDACEQAPQHRYLFLTKNPSRYTQLMEKGIVLPNYIKWWYGYTIDGLKSVPRDAPINKGVFCSVEPIQRKPDLRMLDEIAMTSWAIIGAETGNRKGKIIPERSWIESIINRCRDEMIPVFMKESLRDLMDSDFKQEYPWEV